MTLGTSTTESAQASLHNPEALFGNPADMPRRSIGFEVPRNDVLQFQALQEKVETLEGEIRSVRDENRALLLFIQNEKADSRTEFAALSERVENIQAQLLERKAGAVSSPSRGLKRKMDSTAELPRGENGQNLVPPGREKSQSRSRVVVSQGASSASTIAVGALPLSHVSRSKARNVDLATLVEEANKLKKRFCNVSNPSCPAHVRSIFEEAVEKGNNIAALLQLARLEFGVETLHPHGKRIEQNLPKAKRILSKLNRHPNSFSVQSELQVLEGDILREVGELDKCLEYFEGAADDGDIDGTFKVGRWYAEKVSAEEDQDTIRKYMDIALSNLTKATEAGSGPAAALLGNLYENSDDIALWNNALRDFEREMSTRKGGMKEITKFDMSDRMKKARELYQLSAKRQCAHGHNDLACCFQLGSGGLEKDFMSAVDNFKLAFESGHTGAAANLGLLYDPEAGSFKTQCKANEALRWYELGAKVRCPTATRYLAQTYDDGKLVTRDAAKAISLYRKAIKLAKDDGDLEQAKAAQSDLLKILCTWALVEEDKQATKEMKSSRILEKCREETTWIVAGKLLPRYKDQNTTQDTLKDLTRILGDANTSHLLNYITFMCERIKRPRGPSGKPVDLKRKLRLFVSDDRIRNEIEGLLSS